MNVCTSCGTDNVEGTRFCVKCGTTLSTAPSPGAWQTPSNSQYTPAGNGGVGGSAPSSGYTAAPPYDANAYAQSPGSQYQSSYQQPQASQPSSSYQPGAAVYQPQAYGQSAPSQAGMKAEPVMRLGSWIIDVVGLIVCLIPVIVVGLIPFVGWLIALLGIPAVAVAYHLLRDIQGASLGKHLLGMRVVSKTGGEATNGQRVLRNILFAVPVACMILPIIGHIIGAFLGFAITVTEAIMLLSTGERLGDKLANTVVIKTK